MVLRMFIDLIKASSANIPTLKMFILVSDDNNVIIGLHRNLIYVENGD